MKTEVSDLIAQALKAAEQSGALPSTEGADWEMMVPKEAAHGDISCNVAFKLAGRARRSPREVAQAVIDHLPQSPLIQKAEVAGAGYINFFIASESLQQLLAQIEAEGADFGGSDFGKGVKVNLEFISANPTGPLHVGHGRNATVGDATARIMSAAGFDVCREFYVNDTGVQIENLGRSLLARCRQLEGEEIDLGEDLYHGEYVLDLAKDLLAERKGELPAEAELDDIAQWAADRLLQRIKEVLLSFRVDIDVWTSEREMIDAGKVALALDDLKQRGLLYDKDGALWFKTSESGDDKDRVVVKSDGSKTYFSSDIAYHREKFERGFARLIDVWGADHHGYVQRVKAACAAFGREPDDFQAILIQMVRLMREGREIKMSKRAGEFETLEDVISEVGVDAARTIFLSRRHDAHLDFDLDLAVAKSMDNPVYYIQYMHARICSVFAKAGGQGVAIPKVEDVNLERLESEAERQMLKTVQGLPETVAAAARDLEPHRITNWLMGLAGLFHPWYADHRIISDDEELTAARMLLCKIVKQAAANALALLGVSAPESM